MIKTKVAFLEGRLLSSQSEQSEKFSKSPDWLVKSRLFKKATFVLIMYRAVERLARAWYQK